MTLPGKTQPTSLREPADENGLCFILYVLGALLKFWLIAKSDISDAVDDPSLYVAQVLHPLNGGLSYGPGTGLFGRFFYEFGIPFRLGIELTFMLALTWVLAALIDWPTRNYLACGVFLFSLFNPAPSEIFSHILSDQVWMVMTMLGLAYLVFALRDPLQPKWSQLAISAMFLGFSTITRSVFDLLVACLVLFSLISLLLVARRGGLSKARSSAFTLIVSLGTVLLGVSTFYYAICFYNLRHAHCYGISAVDCREYKDFYCCLQSVGEPDGVNHFPVDEDRRRLIATAGPQSKALMDQLERMNLFKDVGFEAYGKHDIPLGWFQLAVFATYDSDLDKAYAQFKDIEREIHDSAQRGQLKVRTILPLPDCRLNLVLQIFPGALRSTIHQVDYEPVPYPSGWSLEKLHYDDPEFSRALTRRPVSDSPLRYLVWRTLHPIYAYLYTPAALILLLALVAAFWTFLAFAWQPTLENSLSILGQQLFALLFIALIFWYALFDASGMPVQSRYMMFNHVMLPILIVYYVRSFVLLYRGGRVPRQGLGAKA